MLLYDYDYLICDSDGERMRSEDAQKSGGSSKQRRKQEG
jgi:hypothetical protein